MAYQGQAAVVAAITAAALPNPVPVRGNTALDGSTTLATAGTSYELFGGVTPSRGWEVECLGSFDCWVSDVTPTPSATTPGSHRVAANGGIYTTPQLSLPLGPVYITPTANSTPITARSY